ncbi:hypothetical protein HRG_015053 [Hirsutella rhossiliensis]
MHVYPFPQMDEWESQWFFFDAQLHPYQLHSAAESKMETSPWTYVCSTDRDEASEACEWQFPNHRTAC